VISGNASEFQLANSAAQTPLEQKSRRLTEVEPSVFANEFGEHPEFGVRERQAVVQ
jgi:hypothetical protein